MKAKKAALCVFIIITILSFHGFAFSYGYGELGEDPLIRMFKDIVKEAKKKEKNWDNIAKLVHNSGHPIKTLDDFFKLNLSAKFEKALQDKNLQLLIKSGANLVFLSMMEKYELILRDDFKDFNFAKGRLALCEKYYKEIFQNNVLKSDRKNGTNLNEKITKSLKDIQSTIGKSAKFGMGGIPPSRKQYEELYKAIKNNILTVFPYFES